MVTLFLIILLNVNWSLPQCAAVSRFSDGNEKHQIRNSNNQKIKKDGNGWESFS